jgi:hypothetical protein
MVKWPSSSSGGRQGKGRAQPLTLAANRIAF